MNKNELKKLVTQNPTTLNLKGKNINASIVQDLANLLTNNTTIKHLDLSGNNIGYTGAKYIANALMINKNLTVINLSGNNIGYKDAEYIANALRINETLTSINLSGNNIGYKGAKYVSNSLKNNNTLTVINLSGNNIGNKGAKYIANALMINKKLTVINLSGNKIGDKGIKYLLSALKQKYTAIKLPNMLGDEYSRINKNFIKLELTYDEISDNLLLQEINYVLPKNREYLKHLANVLTKVFITKEIHKINISLQDLKCFQICNKQLLQQYMKLDDKTFNACVANVQQHIATTDLKLEVERESILTPSEVNKSNLNNNDLISAKRKRPPQKETTTKKYRKIEDNNLKPSEKNTIEPNHPFTDLYKLISYLLPRDINDPKIEDILALLKDPDFNSEEH